MKHINKLIDVSTWTGHWPFVYYEDSRLYSLKAKLAALNVKKCFVSPIEAILEQDPMRANKQLLRDIDDPFFSPVPIVDLSFGNWDEVVKLAVQDDRVQMVKMIPNYHMYDLHEDNLEQFVEMTQAHNIVIAIQMKVEDKRGQYPLMKVDYVDVLKAVKVMSKFPEQIFLLNNLFMNEMAQVLFSVNNAYVDVSSLEKVDMIKFVQDNYPVDRFLFSSHSPFYIPEGNINKLKYTEAELDTVNKIAFENANHLFKLS